MKSDRELLELAAKAAGFQFDPSLKDKSALFGCFSTDKKQTTYVWYPLNSDEDAFALAVQLELEIYHSWDETVNVYVGYPTPGVKHRTLYIVEKHGSDARQATRRAIVRAAAAIGETL